jgi:hypothetical protein
MRPFQGREHDGSLSLLPHRVRCIGVVGMQAQPPFTTSEMLHSLFGKRVVAPSTPCAIPDAGFKHRFSSL